MKNIINYRCILLENFQDGIGYWRHIKIAKNPLELLKEIKNQVIINSVEILCEAHAEYINMADLEDLFEEYGQEKGLKEDWDFSDVINIVNALIDKREIELIEISEESSILGDWYDVIKWINDILPYGDGLFIPIEDDLFSFINQLYNMELNFFKSEIDEYHKKLKNHKATEWKYQEYNNKASWLGFLATVISEDRWDSLKEGDSYILLNQLFKRFNDTYKFQ